MKFHILFILLLLVFASCKKEDQCGTDAVITGYDMTMCACCGGLMINFNNDTVPYSGSYYLIDDLPAGVSVGNSFPAYVRVDWVADTNACPSNRIDITCLTFR